MHLHPQKGTCQAAGAQSLMGGGESREHLHPLSAAAAGNYTEKYITSELRSWDI